MDTALDQTETEILSCLVPRREGRIGPRAVAARPPCPFPSRKSLHSPISQHASYTVTITTPAHTTRIPASQPEQPTSQPHSPLKFLALR
jgi:hypothetical protein